MDNCKIRFDEYINDFREGLNVIPELYRDIVVDRITSFPQINSLLDCKIGSTIKFITFPGDVFRLKVNNIRIYNNGPTDIVIFLYRNYEKRRGDCIRIFFSLENPTISIVEWKKYMNYRNVSSIIV